MKNHCPVYPGTPLSPQLEYIKRKGCDVKLQNDKKNDLGNNCSVEIPQSFQEKTRDRVLLQ